VPTAAKLKYPMLLLCWVIIGAQLAALLYQVFRIIRAVIRERKIKAMFANTSKST
jgi:hypothetical protein